jgi:protein-disulfide isomerase
VAVLGIVGTVAGRVTAQQKAISDNADAIFRSPLSHVAGNPNGDVSVVEFFDYNSVVVAWRSPTCLSS